MNEIYRLTEAFITERQLAAESYKIQLVAAITALNAADIVLLAMLLAEGSRTKR